MLMCLNLHSVGEITQKVCKFLRCFVKKLQNQEKISSTTRLDGPDKYHVQGVSKKRTFRKLLEPQCTGSITSSRHPLCLEINFLVVS